MLKCANIFISRWEQGQPNTNLRYINWPAVRYFLGDVIVLWLLLFPTWYEMFDTLFLAFEKNTNVAGNWSQFNEKNDTRLRSFKLPLAPAPVNNSTIKAVWIFGVVGVAVALHFTPYIWWILQNWCILMLDLFWWNIDAEKEWLLPQKLAKGHCFNVA